MRRLERLIHIKRYLIFGCHKDEDNMRDLALSILNLIDKEFPAIEQLTLLEGIYDFLSKLTSLENQTLDLLVPISTKKFRVVKNISIEDLQLTIRAENCLRAEDILTIGELLQKTQSDLLKIPNFAVGSLSVVMQCLETYLNIKLAKLY